MPSNGVASSPWFIPVRRALLLWILGRIALLLLALFLPAFLSSAGSGSALVSAKSNILLATALAAVVAVIVVIDLRATREDILLANLGVGQRQSALLAASTVIVIELLLGSLAALASS